MTRIVLVDDHNLVRAGLRALLEDMPGVEVVAEAAEGGAGLEEVRRHRPDVLVTDLSMSGMNGIELTERATRELPALRVVMLSMFSSREHVMRAMSAGASAYLLKDAAGSELARALDAVRRGERFLSPVASRHLRDLAADAGAEDPLALLTPRQREVLQLLAEGVAIKRIAQRLGVSPKTIETHRVAIMERLRVSGFAGLVKVAVSSGLVTFER